MKQLHIFLETFSYINSNPNKYLSKLMSTHLQTHNALGFSEIVAFHALKSIFEIARKIVAEQERKRN